MAKPTTRRRKKIVPGTAQGLNRRKSVWDDAIGTLQDYGADISNYSPGLPRVGKGKHSKGSYIGGYLGPKKSVKKKRK